MTTTRKQYSAKFKARVAVEAIRGEKTLSQLGSQFKVHPIQIAKWRKSALEQLPELRRIIVLQRFRGSSCNVALQRQSESLRSYAHLDGGLRRERRGYGQHK